MSYTLSQIAEALGTTAEGDGTLVLDGLAEPPAAGPRDLALAMDERYAGGLSQGAARAAVLWAGADWQALGLKGAILLGRVRFGMAELTRLMDQGPGIAPGVHPSAVIADDAEIGDGAAIGPFVVIGEAVRIGARARIGAHASIAAGSRVGDDALIHAGVRIGVNVRIGDRFIAQSGVVLGGDGFSFVTPDKSAVEELRASVADGEAGPIAGSSAWRRIHSLGGVEIGDDVEVGANSTIDAGTIRATRVGRGTKIDNLVQIGHNVEVGEDCLLCGQVGVAGSTRIGDRVVLAGQVGVSDNIFIGSDVIAGGGTDIYTNVPAGRAVLGSPAVKIDTEMAIRRELRRLPRLAATVRALQKAVSKDGGND